MSQSFNANLGGQPNNGFMSNIKNTLSKNSGKTILIFVAVFLFALLGGLYYYYYIKPNLSTTQVQYKPNNEKMYGDIEGGQNAELLFFYANWCPHCKSAKPIWEELKAEYANKKVNGYNIVFTEIDCSQETTESDKMMNKYNVEGYPTIKLLKDGQVIEYDAKPSKATLEQFLNTVL